MALFGAPLAQEHHALRACDAALAIQTSLTSLASEGLRVRVGLNSGEVVVRTIRNDLSVDYDAVGQTVHLASRMEQMAEPGGILLTSNTMKLVRGFVAVEPRGRVDVLGFTDKVPVYVLQGRQQVRTRWGAAHETRTLSAFVGREREFGLLAEALAAAADGQAHVIHILGDAGVGKSRLVYEFLRTLEDAKVDVQVTGALRETRSTPYRPITLMLRDWAGLDDGDGDGTAVDKLRHFLTSLCPDLDSNCPALRTILGLSVPEDEGWARSSIRIFSAGGCWTPSAIWCSRAPAPDPWSWLSRTCTGSTENPSPRWTTLASPWLGPPSCSWSPPASPRSRYGSPRPRTPSSSSTRSAAAALGPSSIIFSGTTRA